jgi:hypothetical protein
MFSIVGGSSVWNIAETLGTGSAKETTLNYTYFSEERGCQSASDVGPGLPTKM